MPNYNTPAAMNVMRPVAITSIDTANRSATGTTRFGTAYPIHTGYSVGAIQVTPTIGDQWYIKKVDGEWRLDHQIGFNNPNLLTTPTQGQVQVGSGKGPIEFNGTQINANAPLVIQSVTTSTRPTNVPAGTHVFDTTIGCPIWYSGSGTTWVNGVGTSV